VEGFSSDIAMHQFVLRFRVAQPEGVAIWDFSASWQSDPKRDVIVFASSIPGISFWLSSNITYQWRSNISKWKLGVRSLGMAAMPKHVGAYWHERTDIS